MKIYDARRITKKEAVSFNTPSNGFGSNFRQQKITIDVGKRTLASAACHPAMVELLNREEYLEQLRATWADIF